MGSERFSRSSRLTTAQDYAAALQSRWRTSAAWFSAHVVSSGRQDPRLGLVVSKRVAPRAVDRNRIKRLVREAFRRRGSELGRVDVVIRLKRLPAPSDWGDAGAEIRHLLDRIAKRWSD